MIFYHGTSEENWDKIQKEGILFGRRYILDDKTKKPIREVSRCTYLATDKEEAEYYGNVVLKVNYDPFEHKEHNNYIPNCWQIRVYEPILISNIKRIK